MATGTKFTRDIIKELPPGEYRDPRIENLILRVTTASRRFYYYGRQHGKPVRIPLGEFSEVKLADVKNKVGDIGTAIRAGRDPRQATPTTARRRGGLTLADFFDVYLADYAKDHRQHPDELKANFKKYFTPLADRPLDGITAGEVKSWHAGIKATIAKAALKKNPDAAPEDLHNGHSTANKQVNLLRTIYNKALLWERLDGQRYATNNPAESKLVERFPEDTRDRFLNKDELDRLVEAFEAAPRDSRDFFMTALLTGARKSSLMRMHFDELDLENGLWIIGKNTSKAKAGKKTSRAVPIIERLKRILAERKSFFGSGWVFPGRRANGKPIGNVNFWWEDLRTTAEIEDVTIHDLRRTLGAWMAATGAGEYAIGGMLGHKSQGVTAIYARMAVEPMREAAEKAVAAMMGDEFPAESSGGSK